MRKQSGGHHVDIALYDVTNTLHLLNSSYNAATFADAQRVAASRRDRPRGVHSAADAQNGRLPCQTEPRRGARPRLWLLHAEHSLTVLGMAQDAQTTTRGAGLLLAFRRGHEVERGGLRTHRNNTKRMHWSAYALPISTSIRCNAVATNRQAHRSSGSRNLQRIRWAARTPEATAFCGHGSERGCAKMRAHRMGDAVAQQSAQGKTHEPRPSAKRSVATGRRVCSLDSSGVIWN